MRRPAQPSATSAIALGLGAAPSVPKQAGGAAGEAGSKDALARLTAAVLELKTLAIQPMLQSAINALNAGDHQAGGEWALKVLEKDERNGFAWYLLAMSRERAGDFGSSVTCYESALALLPNHAEVANDLGRLAYRMGMLEQAEKLFRHFLVAKPNHHEGANNLACAIRDLGRFEEAIDVLKPAVLAEPEIPMLWNTMGTIVTEQGDAATGQVFFEESLRLDPDFPKARYNLGNTRLVQGDPAGALIECERAIKGKVTEDERQMMRLSRSTILLGLGRIGEGWDEYEARLDANFADVTHFLSDRPQWGPGMDLAGKSILVFGEQGLGEEVLFANVLPDLISAIGPKGALTLAVERRLVPLFARSFPQASVGSHATYKAAGRTARVAPFVQDDSAIDLWTPLGCLLREFRRVVEAFPPRERFLTTDPDRVAHWRKVLEAAPAGRKVGLLWKSMIKDGARHRFFAGFEKWKTILDTPGISFVNLQYGDCSAEIEQARRDFGVEIWTPPGIDLKQDLDDVAALSCALDLVLGFSNANLNLAAACGAPTWLITNPGSWPRLGSDRYPWYPQARVFAPTGIGEWDPVMDDIARALRSLAQAEH